MAEILDTKPYIEYDSLIGYRYAPNTRRTLPRPGGGTYEIVINAAGIRSTREYSKGKPPGVFRALVFGDSYAAGQFVSSEQRFTEILERSVADLEVINFALEGTGTDQQLLMYENVGREYEHDLVMVFPFLQNIRRNLADARTARDPKTGAEILRPKPRFELRNGELVLKNVPVPKECVEIGESSYCLGQTDANRSIANQIKSTISSLSLGRWLKRAVFAFKPWEPFPEYHSPATPAWRLMEAILRRFHRAVKPRPFVIVPVFYDSYVRFRMARNYLERFRSLESDGIHVIDLLRHFRQLGNDAVRCFHEPYDCHFSPYGHLVVSEALQQELTRRGLLRA